MARPRKIPPPLFFIGRMLRPPGIGIKAPVQGAAEEPVSNRAHEHHFGNHSLRHDLNFDAIRGDSLRQGESALGDFIYNTSKS